MGKPRILILCTGNSCRSHMAEGIQRAAAGDIFEVHSAGSNPAGYVQPRSIAVMTEIGIDISGHESKHMNEFLDREIHTVITVCGNADQACPVYPGQVNRYHWPFDDPIHATGTEDEIMDAFRRARDQIKLVFDAEICAMTRRLMAGLEPREDFPADALFDELLREQTLLMADHTLTYFRQEHYIPGPVIDRTQLQGDVEGAPDLMQRARDEVEGHLARYEPPDVLTREQRRDLEGVMTAAAGEFKIVF